MSRLLAIIVLLATSLASAGVGGISGGNITKGHILFQDYSVFVNPVYHKSLCFDGASFHAIVNVCADRENNDESKCLNFKKVAAEQPMKSTREVCVQREGSSDECVKWQRKSFVQEPVRTLEISVDDEVVKRIEYKVPGCR